MKIIAFTPEKIAPAAAPVPPPTPADATSGLQAELNALAIQKLSDEFEAFKGVVAEWREEKSIPLVPVPMTAAESAPAPAPAPDNPLVMQTLTALSQQVVQLTDALAELRGSVDKLESAKPTAAAPVPMPAPAPAAVASPAVKPVFAAAAPRPSRDAFLSKMGGAAPAASPERQVAFFSKVWDYLNQVAFEAPDRKKS